MMPGSGGAQAKIRWPSMTACSWLRLGVRKRRSAPGLLGGGAVGSAATLTRPTSACFGHDLSVTGHRSGRPADPRGTTAEGCAFGL